METKLLEENNLPKLPEDAKKYITLGHWSLYEIEYHVNMNIHYMLSTTENDYMLDSNGYPLIILNERKDITYLNRISFDMKDKIYYIDISI